MKKELLIIILGCMVSASYAQLKVFQNGNVALKSDSDEPQSALSIACDGEDKYTIKSRTDVNGINCVVDGKNFRWGNAGDFITFSDNTDFSVGIKAEIRSQGFQENPYGRSFGVFGTAGFSTSGWNYGVFGRLDGTANGSAVYGTVSSLENGIGLDKRYAGYFNGEVGISGNLKVTGSIDGVIVGKAAEAVGGSIRNARTTDPALQTVHDRLAGICAVQYMEEQPVMALAAAEGDTAVTARQLNEMEAQSLSKPHYVLSAEQLETVYPELVYTNGDGTKAINYMELIPLLVQSIGELSAKIETLENQAGIQRAPRQQAAMAGIDGTGIQSQEVKLFQNSPNPFTQTTSIKINVPSASETAMLAIYDLSGKQIKDININGRGEQSITISSEGLSPGMYLYSLIVDGKLIDTKRMIITK